MCWAYTCGCIGACIVISHSHLDLLQVPAKFIALKYPGEHAGIHCRGHVTNRGIQLCILAEVGISTSLHPMTGTQWWNISGLHQQCTHTLIDETTFSALLCHSRTQSVNHMYALTYNHEQISPSHMDERGLYARHRPLANC